MEIRTVSIIGLGALGIMYGDYMSGRLPAGDLRIVADENRIIKYRKQGIYCNEKQCHFTYLTDQEENPADLLIFAVKFGQLEEAIRSVGHQVGENTIILSTLNGITSEDYLAEAFGENRVLLCTVQGMDAVKEGNQMTYHHMGYVCVGTKDGSPSPYLDAVTKFFDRIKLPYRLPEDMQRQLWNKLLLNVGVNQAVAVYETNYGGVQKDGQARDTMLLAMKEVLKIAQAKKINLSDDDITNWIGVINSLDPQGKPSMRQDTQAHRSTEVELFSGTINRLGQEYGIATPVNEMLYRRIKEMEA